MLSKAEQFLRKKNKEKDSQAAEKRAVTSPRMGRERKGGREKGRKGKRPVGGGGGRRGRSNLFRRSAIKEVYVVHPWGTRERERGERGGVEGREQFYIKEKKEKGMG